MTSQQGRPSGFRPEVVQLAKTGITQPEIAAELGCTNRTLSRWALRYPEFRAALDRGLVRRKAERRAAAAAPLRKAASELRRMIADAMIFGGACEAPLGEYGSDDSTLDGAFTSTTRSVPHHGIAQARRERQAVRYSPVEAEPDPSDGEPVELLDPRSDW